VTEQAENQTTLTRHVVFVKAKENDHRPKNFFERKSSRFVVRVYTKN
jgi:hypothetical protein